MDLANVPLPTLQLWLGQAQASWASWQAGGKIASVSYSQGDGSKNVTYATADANQLRAWIASLQRQIGLLTGQQFVQRRRAIGIRF